MSKQHLHICHSLDFGGITTFVKSLIELNSENQTKHKILVWNKSASGEHIIDISEETNKKEAFQTIVKEFDLLFVHSLKPFMLSSLRGRKKAVYLFQHGITFGSGFRKLTKRIFYFSVLNLFGFKVVCSSEFAKSKLLKNTVVFNKSIFKIIPFGVNLNHSDYISETTNTINLGFAGRLVSQKRIHKIYDAFQLLECSLTINFKVAGTGPLMNQLEEKSRSLIDRNITTLFEGHVKDMTNFFSNIDVLLLPSIGESYGLVVLEAFFNNIPVIVFEDTGACVDFIIPNENGFIVKNTTELSQLICKLNSDDLRGQLKHKIKDMDLSKFHISNTKLLLDEL